VAGDVLVELDTRVERSQLASARARERLAASNLARTKTLVETGAIGAAQLDTDSAQLDGAKADADALAQQIERKIVRAPFAGKLGIRLVNVGQYLAPGTPITELESADGTYADFDLPQQDLAQLSVGMPVRLEMEATDGGVAGQPSEGAIAAVSPEVDPTTRNIRVRASVPPKDDRLRPGMFVDVEVVLPQKASVVAIPETAVVYASYGDSVFVVEGPSQAGGAKAVRQQFVKLGPSRGDFVAVADGVTAGQEVVTGGAFKLRNGMRVAVKNAVEASPQLQPHPANR
jgi:membrane fusion protein (multidrug efflux system)